MPNPTEFAEPAKPAKSRRRDWLAASLTLPAALLLSAWLRPQFYLDAVLGLQRSMAGAADQQQRVDDTHWAWLEAGVEHAGPPLLLVHGFTGSRDNWLPVMRHLAETRRVIAPDLPGWGDSERQSGADYGFAAQAERLSAFIAALNLGRVDLVGHSMGGGIAAVLAARHPEQVNKLVLMDAAGVRFDENAFGLAVLAGDNPFAVNDRASLQRYLSSVFESPPWVPWPIDRALIQRRSADADFEQTVLDHIGRGADAFLPGSLAAQIKADTLLLWCREDRVIDASAAAIWAAELASTQTVFLDDCNHMPMMEQPTATADALRGFLF